MIQLSSVTGGSMTTPSELSPEHGFGACLMVKNDNELLYEWIAYHYTMLPLRFLVILNDSGSIQDPMQVLQRWNSTRLQYWIWQQKEPAILEIDSNKAHKLLVARQNTFIRDCSIFLKSQNVTWVTHTDPDEYVLLNRISAEDDDPSINKTKPVRQFQNATLHDILQIRSEINENWTALDLLQHVKYKNLISQSDACQTMTRVRFGALESDSCSAFLSSTRDLIQKQTSIPYRRMYSLRFQLRAGRDNAKINKWGKVMMDVSVIPMDRLQSDVRNVHRPYKPECGEPLLPSAESLFLVAHYIGDWKQHAGVRIDVRRSREGWEEKAYINERDSCYMKMETWFHRFAEQVGLDKAEFLLGGRAKSNNTI
jgi:hypothetical protein